MTLFDVGAVKKFQHAQKPKSAHLKPSPAMIEYIQSNQELKSIMDNLEKHSVYPFWTEGGWSLHELIIALAYKIGPCSLHLTTWTITEEPMRMIFQSISEGIITDLTCLFDYRIEKRKAEAFQLAKVNSARIKLSKVHAKTAILQNKEWRVSVIGSSNMTKNPRLEAGTLFTMPEVADFYENMIEQHL